MSTQLATVPAQRERKSILQAMAARYDMEPEAFERTLRHTVAKPDPKTGREISREEFAACLVVANEHGLNPLTKEIYFFPDSKRGGVVPVVGVDGWARIINEHPQFDGMEFLTEWQDNGKPESVECRMFRKDRSRPVCVVEYFTECVRETDPWRKSPARMLRHKAMIQAARYAFGFSGLHDEDDADFIVNGDAPRDITPRQAPPPPPAPVPIQRRPPPPPPAERSAPPPPPPADPAPLDDGIPDHLTGADPDTGEVWQDEAQLTEEQQALLDKARGRAMAGATALRLWLAQPHSAEDRAFLETHMAALQSAAAQADGGGR